ncbi:hypothetical protein HUB98_06105 [Paenibacillus barcinonensis]|uniref:Uncharacterized protein n=1 Tax=Paenibacillus barcinonensis TaxID=198119 RepID=A0A2V4W0E1_PAEBA|nr:hypothetical protein [Paenibacillus barcinonensis]PYE51585.1 hypothetical protein DFQ00_102380 [Paenibacillus barcinonensis]QKS55953.1 hypothetical protein HUB98_06105 [Paenibacillus barcinonensis]
MKRELNVSIKFSNAEEDWVVNVWDSGSGFRIPELEEYYLDKESCYGYVNSLKNNPKYIVSFNE